MYSQDFFVIIVQKSNNTSQKSHLPLYKLFLVYNFNHLTKYKLEFILS